MLGNFPKSLGLGIFGSGWLGIFWFRVLGWCLMFGVLDSLPGNTRNLPFSCGFFRWENGMYFLNMTFLERVMFQA